jgi:hypothetical protein
MSWKDDDARSKSIASCRVKCQCSHIIIMAKIDRTICSHCKRWVYRTPAIEFKYKMKEKLKDGRILSNNN